jgi:hypothetical protein
MTKGPLLLIVALATLATVGAGGVGTASVGAGGVGTASDGTCDESRCPPTSRVTLTPRLRQLDPGGLRAEVVAFDSRGAGNAPRDAELEQAALAVLGSERRSGGLAQALGTVRLRPVQVGDLDARGRRLGATMLVDLVAPRRNVWATVPAYVPVDRSSGRPYTPQSVRMHLAVLRDALIDIDLGRRRVIAFQPGPRSESLSWSPSQAPAPAGAGDEI